MAGTLAGELRTTNQPTNERTTYTDPPLGRVRGQEVEARVAHGVVVETVLVVGVVVVPDGLLLGLAILREVLQKRTNERALVNNIPTPTTSTQPNHKSRTASLEPARSRSLPPLATSSTANHQPPPTSYLRLDGDELVGPGGGHRQLRTSGRGRRGHEYCQHRGGEQQGRTRNESHHDDERRGAGRRARAGGERMNALWLAHASEQRNARVPRAPAVTRTSRAPRAASSAVPRADIFVDRIAETEREIRTDGQVNVWLLLLCL